MHAVKSKTRSENASLEHLCLDGIRFGGQYEVFVDVNENDMRLLSSCGALCIHKCRSPISVLHDGACTSVGRFSWFISSWSQLFGDYSVRPGVDRFIVNFEYKYEIN